MLWRRDNMSKNMWNMMRSAYEMKKKTLLMNGVKINRRK